MLNEYSDIKDRLGEPLWYDQYGVPRYEPFHPKLCGVYADYVAYQEIACQACGKRFFVAVEYDFEDKMRAMTYARMGGGEGLPPVRLPTVDSIGDFYYGDPPRHSWEECCAGDTMSSDEVRVVEFWVKDKEGGFEWRRDTACEVDYVVE